MLRIGERTLNAKASPAIVLSRHSYYRDRWARGATFIKNAFWQIRGRMLISSIAQIELRELDPRMRCSFSIAMGAILPCGALG
jgi:hypothetical protein